MTKSRGIWVFSPSTPAAPKVSADLKSEIKQKADQLVETVLKPKHIKLPPKNNQFNYIMDIYTKWHGQFFYFCAKYCSPGPNAMSPDFETKFARLAYVGENRFNLSFMRHTGQWIEIYSNLPMDDCLTAIQDDPSFFP